MKLCAVVNELIYLNKTKFYSLNDIYYLINTLPANFPLILIYVTI